jgi:hypothetical protein
MTAAGLLRFSSEAEPFSSEAEHFSSEAEPVLGCDLKIAMLVQKTVSGYFVSKRFEICNKQIPIYYSPI